MLKSRFFQAIVVILVSSLPITAWSQLMINEVSAANYTDFTDNYGEYEDWFEIYNPTGAAIDLDGYYLSDDVADPTKFQITASVMVPAGGYRVVFASNKNTIVGNDIHTSFKINQQAQEYAVLSEPGGTLVDLFWIENPNQMNHSWGRMTDGSPTWGLFNNPSPGAANTGAFTGYADTPVFDLASGEQAGPVNVNISTSQAGITIRYGVDGDEPTNTSTVAAGPIAVANTTVIHARAYSSDPMILPSFMETNTYLINEGHVLPVISISGPEVDNLINGNGGLEPIGELEFFGADGQLKDKARGDFNEHGNDSWAYDQRGLDYIARDQMGYNDEIHHPIFRTKDRPSYKRLILKAAANDNYPFSIPPGGGCHVIDAYIHSISQIGELRMDERSHEPCILYVNGEYWGVYDVREKVDDLDFTEYYYNQGENEVDFIKTWGGTWNEYDSGTAYEWDDLVTFITSNDMTDQANYDYVKSIYNTGSLIDYFVLNSYVVTTDWLNWNTGWWRGRNPNGEKKKWRYILWDNDASFGQYINFTGIPDTSPQADPCNPESIGDPGGQGHVPILNALMANEEFYNDYITRFVDLSQSTFSCTFMQAHLDSLTNMIAPEMQRQTDRWGGSVPDWQNNIQVIRDFIDDRCASFNDGILDCFDVDGPYPVVVNVMPPGAGWVEFNSLELTDLPWTGEYFGNLDIEMEANANGINVFSHWELNNHTLDDYLVDTAYFTFTQADTITAWFVTETSDIVLDVAPDGAGEIEFFGTNYSSLPTTVTAPEGVNLDLVATPNGNFYEFDHWELNNHTLDPDVFTDAVEINVDTTDFIVAHFNELENYNVTLMVDPPMAGNIIFESTLISSYPHNSGQLLADTDYSLDVFEAVHYSFSHYTLSNQLVDDETVALNSFTLSQDDVITAHFVEDENYTITYDVRPLGAGELILDGELLDSYPTTRKYYEPDLSRVLEAVPVEYYNLVNWDLLNNTALPNDNSEQISVDLMANDTIVANFAREFYGYFLPNAFTPNGDGVNDIYKVTGNAVDMEFYEFSVFDRNGQLVFQTTDINKGWNGAARTGSNYFAENGVYVYRMIVRSVFDSHSEEVMGNILLTR